eukprot:TRINITY_DN60672_c0_g1_i1.p1 TRINITY_DN60672_c0_g1~~TRINITY_DN60672_c0_g1_i1.p1  ORF type:complete len:218 (+),score=35.60 TRINITY_DN60672_c0_g1_i1:33-656(+)
MAHKMGRLRSLFGVALAACGWTVLLEFPNVFISSRGQLQVSNSNVARLALAAGERERSGQSVRELIEARKRKMFNKHKDAGMDDGKPSVNQDRVNTFTRDLSAFEHIRACQWLPGTVQSVSIRSNRVVIDVKAPGSSAVARGHAQQKRGEALMIGQDALAVGQEVYVRVVSLDRPGGFLVLSLDGDPAVMRADLEAQLQRMQAQHGA